MKKINLKANVHTRKIAILSFSILILLSFARGSSRDPADWVNVFIGTQDGGNTTPAAHAPFGMISFGPTNLFGPNESDPYISRSGYVYTKDKIANFSLTHVSGWGCHGAQDIPFMPVTGDIEKNPVYNPAAYASSFSHANEEAGPGYYKVFLDDYDVQVNSAVSERASIMELSYSEKSSPKVVFMPTNCSNGITGAYLHVNTEKNEVEGYATSGGFCTRDPELYDYTVYFVAKFNKSITDFGGWNGLNNGIINTKTLSGDSIAAFVSFDSGEINTLEMRIGISFVSIENAYLNLEKELNNKNIANLQSETQMKWNKGLSKMKVETNDKDLKTQLYTALYHNMLHPNIFEDVNGEYRGFNDSVYVISKGRNKYVNFSNWDTYRTTAQLQGLLFPDRASDMIHSLYLDTKQGCPSGFPIWGYFNNESWVMNGYSGLPVVANLYAFGGRNIDLKSVKDRMIWAADNKYRRGEKYIQHGYVPDYESSHNYCVSMTIEYSIDDYSVAQMCKYAGDRAEYKRFLSRSDNIFNLFNEENGYLQRKTAAGEWVTPFDSSSKIGYNEGNAAQYTWNIPQNLPKLIEKIGGKEKTIERLDYFTSRILREGWNIEVPFYWPANQPSFIAPFVYNYAGAPEKARKLIRKTITSIFSNSPNGLPGNCDLGATSAMYLFQIAGMYPLEPGVPEFALTGSLVKKLAFQLDNGSKITIKTKKGDLDKNFIKSVKLNGKKHDSFEVNIENLIKNPSELDIEFVY